jgi:hypothetical protein
VKLICGTARSLFPSHATVFFFKSPEERWWKSQKSRHQ